MHRERHSIERIGWLRAAVLGANDGIVSTASLLLGVAAASALHSALMIAGVAGWVAGAMSMATGEYVSVSSQADTEKAAAGRVGIGPQFLSRRAVAAAGGAVGAGCLDAAGAGGLGADVPRHSRRHRRENRRCADLAGRGAYPDLERPGDGGLLRRRHAVWRRGRVAPRLH